MHLCRPRETLDTALFNRQHLVDAFEFCLEEILVEPDAQKEREHEKDAHGDDDEHDATHIREGTSYEEKAHKSVEEQSEEKEEGVDGAACVVGANFVFTLLQRKRASGLYLHFVVAIADFAAKFAQSQALFLYLHVEKPNEAVLVGEQAAATRAKFFVQRACFQTDAAQALRTGRGLLYSNGCDRGQLYPRQLWPGAVVEVNGVKRF